MDDLPVKRQIAHLKLAKAKYEATRAQYELALVQSNFRPSLNFPVALRRERGAWLCVMETSSDYTDCPHAFGDCPSEALLNFDLMWWGRLNVAQQNTEYGGDDEDEDDDNGEF